MIIEITPHGETTACLSNGEAITANHESAQDWRDCISPGDVQPACEYILDNWPIEFRTIQQNESGAYENVIAGADTKRQCCETIYFESASDFADERTAEIYLIWDVASQLVESEWIE